MEIKANMASYIEPTDLCTCVAGIMMYDKCRDERARAALPRLAMPGGQGTVLCNLWLLLNRVINNHVTKYKAMLNVVCFRRGLLQHSPYLKVYRLEKRDD